MLCWVMKALDLFSLMVQHQHSILRFVLTVLQIHANCRIRRVYFSDRLYSEDELPAEFKLYLPVQNKKQWRTLYLHPPLFTSPSLQTATSSPSPYTTSLTTQEPTSKDKNINSTPQTLWNQIIFKIRVSVKLLPDISVFTLIAATLLCWASVDPICQAPCWCVMWLCSSLSPVLGGPRWTMPRNGLIQTEVDEEGRRIDFIIGTEAGHYVLTVGQTHTHTRRIYFRQSIASRSECDLRLSFSL